MKNKKMKNTKILIFDKLWKFEMNENCDVIEFFRYQFLLYILLYLDVGIKIFLNNNNSSKVKFLRPVLFENLKAFIIMII